MYPVYVSKWFAFNALKFLCNKKQLQTQWKNENVIEENETGDVSSEEDPLQDDADPKREEVLMPSVSPPPLLMYDVSADRDKMAAVSVKVDRAVNGATGNGTGALSLNGAISDANSVSNSCSIYGQYVANKLMNYSDRTRAIVEHKINNILFEADMGNFDQNSNV